MKPSDNFIFAGGDSIGAVQLLNEVERKMNNSLPNLLEIILNGSFEESYAHVSSHGSVQGNEQLCHRRSHNSQLETASDAKKMKLNDNLCFLSLSRRGVYFSCQNKLRKLSDLSTTESCHHLVPKLININSRNFSLAVDWRYNLKKCIDASVLAVHSRLVI